MKRLFLLVGIFVVVGLALGIYAQPPKPGIPGKISIYVHDEAGHPVSDATAGIDFVINTFKNPIIDGSTVRTDAKGLVTAEGSCDGSVYFAAKKAGYYDYHHSYHYNNRVENRWQPWNPQVDAVLKKIIQPTPLYAKQTTVELPCDAWPVGFDLIEGDWVAPYGKGKSADFILRTDRVFASAKEYDVTLQFSFANPGDGILPVPGPVTTRFEGSALLLPQSAPEGSYLTQYVWQEAATDRLKNLAAKPPSKPAANQGYFFRVRTQLDSQGRVVRTMYGKIQGEVWIFPGVFQTAHAEISFTYYLNPSGQPNLEFDTVHNLFGKLPVTEEVREP